MVFDDDIEEAQLFPTACGVELEEPKSGKSSSFSEGLDLTSLLEAWAGVVKKSPRLNPTVGLPSPGNNFDSFCRLGMIF